MSDSALYNGRTAAEKNGTKNTEKRVFFSKRAPDTKKIKAEQSKAKHYNCATHLGHLHEGHGPLLHARPARAALHHHRETVLPPVLEGSRDLLPLCASQRTTCEERTSKKGLKNMKKYQMENTGT